jgi:hypothetical protein
MRMLWITVGRSGDKWCELWIISPLTPTLLPIRGPRRKPPLEAIHDVFGPICP